MSTAQEVERARLAAKKVFMFEKDVARASELGIAALSLYGVVDVVGSKRGDLAHALAGFFREVGDLDRCEPLAREAVELEYSDAARPAILGDYLVFLAELLHERGKSAEALSLAKEGLAVLLRDASPSDPELIFVHGAIAKIERALR